MAVIALTKKNRRCLRSRAYPKLRRVALEESVDNQAMTVIIQAPVQSE